MNLLIRIFLVWMQCGLAASVGKYWKHIAFHGAMPLVCRRMSRNGILGFSAEPESKKPAAFLEFCRECGFWISGSDKNADGYDMAIPENLGTKKSTKFCHFESFSHPSCCCVEDRIRYMRRRSKRQGWMKVRINKNIADCCEQLGQLYLFFENWCLFLDFLPCVCIERPDLFFGPQVGHVSVSLRTFMLCKREVFLKDCKLQVVNKVFVQTTLCYQFSCGQSFLVASQWLCQGIYGSYEKLGSQERVQVEWYGLKYHKVQQLIARMFPQTYDNRWHCLE